MEKIPNLNQAFETPKVDKEGVLSAWRKAFDERKGEIIDHDTASMMFDEVSSVEAFSNNIKLTLPGSFSFGENPDAFHIIYAELCGQEAADRVYQHEMEHYAVYKKYGVPVDFGVVVSRLSNGKLFTTPLISPKFPENFTQQQRVEIAFEANTAVESKSERDQSMMDKYKQD